MVFPLLHFTTNLSSTRSLATAAIVHPLYSVFYHLPITHYIYNLPITKHDTYTQA
jgi:hypothetical protein